MPRPHPVTPRGLHQHRCPRHSGSHGSSPAALAVWHSQPSLWLLVALPGEGFWQEERDETEPESRGCIAPNSPGPRNAGSALPGHVDAQGAPVFHQNPWQGGRENESHSVAPAEPQRSALPPRAGWRPGFVTSGNSQPFQAQQQAGNSFPRLQLQLCQVVSVPRGRARAPLQPPNPRGDQALLPPGPWALLAPLLCSCKTY